MKTTFAIGAAVTVACAAVTLSAAAAATQFQLPRGITNLVPTDQASYSGMIQFTWEVKGPHGLFKENWTAAVGAGRASCTGTSDDTSDGQTTHVALNGPGLLTLRFEGNQYSFEFACPVAEHPNESSWTDTEASFKQPGSEKQELKGQWTEPSDEDPVNGVTGHKTVSWHLCYKAKLVNGVCTP